MGRPSNRISPASRLTRPSTILLKVVLPDALGPTYERAAVALRKVLTYYEFRDALGT